MPLNQVLEGFVEEVLVSGAPGLVWTTGRAVAPK